MDFKKLTIEEKVGQMLMFAFHGTTYNDQLNNLIQELKLGGVVHFARNITGVEQVFQLNQEIQANATIPLFIGIDQEGGSVLRVMDGIVPLPGAMALAAANTEPYELCKLVGRDLRALGFTMNYAPVGDVNNNPLNPVINSRSYSDDANVVAKYAISAFRGFQVAGLLPTIKHFPGHGNTSVDSHVGLPVVHDEKEAIHQTEIVPFRRAIEAGIDGVMVAHIVFSNYDAENPATLSKKIVTDLLKDELGFRGLVVTDSLTMGAIAKKYSKEEVVLKAVNAGIDILIFCGKAELDDQREIYNIFVQYVKDGTISMERLDESVRKILAYKEQYAIKTLPNVNILDIVGRSEWIAYAKEIQQKSTTIVKNNGMLPLSPKEKIVFITTKIKLFSLVDNENQDYKTINDYLKVEEIIIEEKTTNLSQIEEISKKYDKIVFATYNVQPNDFQTKVFQLLDNTKTIVISMRSPYDILHLGDVFNYMCIYEATPLSFECAAHALFDVQLAKGRLPVKLERT